MSIYTNNSILSEMTLRGVGRCFLVTRWRHDWTAWPCMTSNPGTSAAHPTWPLGRVRSAGRCLAGRQALFSQPLWYNRVLVTVFLHRSWSSFLSLCLVAPACTGGLARGSAFSCPLLPSSILKASLTIRIPKTPNFMFTLAQNSPVSSRHARPTDTSDDILLRCLKDNLKLNILPLQAVTPLVSLIWLNGPTDHPLGLI